MADRTIRRHLAPRVQAALRDTPAVFLAGARQTGKTTLARALVAEGILDAYVTLDDPTQLAAAAHDPPGFLAALPRRTVLDEVQRAPGLFPALRAAIDRDRRPGRFLLTGSADVLLLPGLAQTLTGRMEILTLEPFSQGEREGRPEGFLRDLFAPHGPAPGPPLPREEVCRRIVEGGFPEACARADPERRAAWFDSYVALVTQREVRELARIEGVAELPHLLRLLAARLGGLLNRAELARSAGLAQTTLARYLSLLQALFLVRPLRAWARNRAKRLIRAPKVHLIDTGLAAHLLGLDADGLARSDRLGRLLEGFVACELRRQRGWALPRARLHHFRTAGGAEVDLVVELPDGRVAGIEVKAAATVHARDLRGLKALADAAGGSFVRGVLLHLGEAHAAFGERLVAMPLSSLWRPAAEGRGGA